MYNPSGTSRLAVMKFPINTQHVSVTDGSGNNIKSQVSEIIAFIVNKFSVQLTQMQIVLVNEAASLAHSGLRGTAKYELVIRVLITTKHP